ncbi:MAG: hypothetical protein EOO51_03505 [Flavobacterium sp.]|nr:MAG: hypothetical protein EOO51_03505 [Flavobacterium sp.]
MNVTEFTFLLNRPDAVNDKQTLALEKIVHQFPYFQSARALRLKGLYNQNSFQYNYALKITAAYTTDRSVLFDFITSDTFTAIHKGLYEQKLAELFDIDVKDSEVVTKDAGLSSSEKIELSILTSIRESETPFQQEETQMEDVVAATNEQTVEITAVEMPVESVESKENPAVELPVIEMPGGEITFVPVTSEEKLGIGKPLEFSKDERHSFQEWLQLSRLKPIVREPEQPDPGEIEKQKKNELIERFIQSSPKITPIKDYKPAPVAEPAKEDSSALMTETLARVYLEQKKYQKAIQAYEILILKYPEKSLFFADRISEIKNLQQNNN